LCFLLIEFCLDCYDLCLPDCLRLLPVPSGNLDQSLFLLSLQHSTCSSYSPDKCSRKSDGLKSKRFFRSRRSQHGQHIGISRPYVISMPEGIEKYCTSLVDNKICNVNLHFTFSLKYFTGARADLVHTHTEVESVKNELKGIKLFIIFN
jgi:hypothetical protein